VRKACLTAVGHSDQRGLELPIVKQQLGSDSGRNGGGRHGDVPHTKEPGLTLSGPRSCLRMMVAQCRVIGSPQQRGASIFISFGPWSYPNVG